MRLFNYLFITFFVFTLSVSAFSQDWIPIAENDTYHYELVGATTPDDVIQSYGGLVLKNSNPADATISIDSTMVSAGQTIYELNKVVTRCETCPWNQHYRNQPQFLQHRMVHFAANDKIVFEGDTNWEIFPKAALGATWFFNAAANVTAQVSNVESGVLLGALDSLKTITLSTGEEIVLSKLHGIVRFPKFDDGTYYELIGIQTRDLGFTIPGAEEIYNFEVGDVFQYDERAESYFPYFYKTTQIQILDKIESASDIQYDVKKHTYNISSDQYYFPPTSDTTFYTSYSSYIFSKDEMADITPGRLLDIEADNCYNQFNFFEQSCIHPFLDLSPNKYLRMYYGQNEDDKWVNFAATDLTDVFGSSMISNFALEGSTPDLLYLNDGCLERYYRVWEEGLGETLYRLGTNGCEYYYNRHLEGYIKNGDTTGIITPFDAPIVVNPEILLETDAITVFSNPTTDDLQIKLASGNYRLSILDINGNVYQTLNLNSDYIIDTNELPTGLYFVEIKNLNNNKIQVKKILKE